MALVDMRDMLLHAYRNNYAIGAFDLVSLDFLEAIVMAAERQKAPVILSLAESHFEHYDFELAMAAAVAAARCGWISNGSRRGQDQLLHGACRCCGCPSARECRGGVCIGSGRL